MVRCYGKMARPERLIGGFATLSSLRSFICRPALPASVRTPDRAVEHIDQVLLAGMSANLCVQAHMHELLEQGFEVAVIKDATAAAQIPEGDGYLAALNNFRFMANAVWTTDEAVKRLSK